MENFLIDLSNTLNLTQPMSMPDFFVLIGILFLLILTLINIFSKTKSDAKEVVETSKDNEKEVPPSSPAQLETRPEPIVKPEIPSMSWEKRLFKGLGKTRSEVWGKVTGLLSGSKLDDSMVEEIEEILFTSDMSPILVDELLEKMKTVQGEQESDYLLEIKKFLKDKMITPQSKVNTELYELNSKSQIDGPKVIMIVGVNGAGKTTTIGKLATKLRSQGANVVVGACDTFRAAAVEQLEVWCNRAGVEIVKAHEGADPSGVAYDAVAKAKEINADYCIIDTAGRLHTKSNLMDELAKTKKVMSKVIPDAPHETLLVLDAITGQNAMRQAEEFNKYLELTGLIFTKCDGSSKAGSAVSIVQNLSVPIVYIGVGEDVDDLDIFELDPFLDALLGTQGTNELREPVH